MPINQNRNNNNKTQIDTNYAHLQPQAVELEKVVLGALMIDTDAFSVVSEMLKPETFYDPRHQKIYEAIQTMNMEERPVDIMTVTDELTKMGAIEKIGGAGYLMEISRRWLRLPTSSTMPESWRRNICSDSSSIMPATSRPRRMMRVWMWTNSCSMPRVSFSSSLRVI